MTGPPTNIRTEIGILWDLDGVLVDSAEAHYQAWAETLEKHSVRLSRENFQRTFGMNNTGILATLLGGTVSPELSWDIGEAKEALFRDRIRGNVRMLPGVKFWLEEFQARRISQVVASSAPGANISTILEELAIRSFFFDVVSAAQMPGKPDPAVFLEAANRIKMPHSRCLVIEDSVAGVEAALAANMKCVAVTNTNPRNLLRSAHVILDSLEELSWERLAQLLELS
jgi:HAD superfamily hydrolase (TIGR01509 family)